MNGIPDSGLRIPDTEGTAAGAVQVELPLRLRQRDHANDVRELEQLLRGREWMTRREIGRLRPDWMDDDGRYIRLLASRSGKIVSGPGAPGYRLADDSTIDDLDVDAALREAANRLIAQMRREAISVRHYRTTLGLRRALRERLAKERC